MWVTASTAETELTGLDVYVIGHHAYVAGGASGLYMVNISRPANPKKVATVNTPGETKGVYAISSFVYVAGPGFGLGVFDVIDRSRLNPNGPFWCIRIDKQQLPGKQFFINTNCTQNRH
jgi:hypothetical protein